MLRVQSVLPDVRLAPFIVRYVQRESNSAGSELVEPVVARLGTMLEFLFADPYFIPAFGAGSPRPCPPITMIVFGSSVSPVYQKLGDSSSLPARKELLDAFFLQRLTDYPALDPRAKALQLLMSSRVPLTVRDAARLAGVSARDEDCS